MKDLLITLSVHRKEKVTYILILLLNITRGCDCEGHPMKLFVRDVGVFASTVPEQLIDLH